MKITNTAKKKSTFQGIFKTKEQAKIALTEIFKNSDEERLSLQMFDLLISHPNQDEINKILDDFKSYVTAYEVNDLLALESKIEGLKDDPNIKPGIVIGLSLLLIDVCWNVFGKKIHMKEGGDPWDFDESSKETQILLVMTNHIDIELVNFALFDTLQEVVGEKFYKEFLEQVSVTDDDKKNFELLGERGLKDPKTSLMIYMGLFRTFLEAVFFLLYDPEFDKTFD